MTYMQIIDNFLTNHQWLSIYSALDSGNFPWYLNKDTSYEGDNYRQTTHTFYKNYQVNSSWFNLIEPLIVEFENQTSHRIQNLIRIRSNLLFNRLIDEETKQKVIHQDMVDPNHISLLYYLNDSDGDTIMYQDDKETEIRRVTPKANRAVIFDSRIWHTAELPIKNQTRQVVNCIFEVRQGADLVVTAC
jgi:hypothetical protein